jgi:O-antigen/teichoic acid export membrane protein
VDIVIIANGIALQLLEPALARALGQKDAVGAQRLISSSVLVSVGLSAMIAIPLGLAASFYLGLFGPDFVAGAPALRILLLGHMLAFLCGPVAVILVMQGHERLVMWTALGALVCNAGLNLALIPNYGINGAAAATALSAVLFKLCLFGAVLRLTPFDPTPWRPLVRQYRAWRG